jgi:hypothetical protein
VSTVKAYDTAYPGSMFPRSGSTGGYVERDDAASLAAALLEQIAASQSKAELATDALNAAHADNARLRAANAALTEALKRIERRAFNEEPCEELEDAQRDLRVIYSTARAALASVEVQ